MSDDDSKRISLIHEAVLNAIHSGTWITYGSDQRAEAFLKELRKSGCDVLKTEGEAGSNRELELLRKIEALVMERERLRGAVESVASKLEQHYCHLPPDKHPGPATSLVRELHSALKPKTP